MAGPTLWACAQSGDFGQCFRQSFWGETVAPAQPVVVESTGPARAPVAGETPQDAAAPEAPAPVAPRFELVRVEPDGSAVIAGTARPGAEIRIFADETPIGVYRAGAGGDWAVVLDTPIPAGGVELRILDTETEIYGPGTVVVVIDEEEGGEPLVVAAEPGTASAILQGLDRPGARRDGPAPLEVAGLSSPAAPEPVAPARPAASPSVVEGSVPAVPAAPVPQQGTGEAAVVPLEPASSQAREGSVPAAPRSGAEDAIRPAVPPVADEGEPAVPEERASAQAEGGALAPPAASQAPGVPQAGEGGAPAQPAAPAPVAGSPAAAPPASDGSRTPPASEAGGPAQAVPPAAAAAPSIDAIEIDGDRTYFAGGGEEEATMRLYVDNTHLGDTVVADGRWLIESGQPLAAPRQRVRVDMLAPDGEVTARAEVDFLLDLPGAEPAPEEEAAPGGAAVPTLTARLEDGAAGAGRVIIRRGDNLWTIARRVYGQGVRFTQIYDANAEQIRNPHLIYPGQVFSLPETDMVIGEDEA